MALAAIERAQAGCNDRRWVSRLGRQGYRVPKYRDKLKQSDETFECLSKVKFRQQSQLLDMSLPSVVWEKISLDPEAHFQNMNL